MLPNRFRTERYQIVSVPLASHLQHKYNERFFVYRHRFSGNFVVCYWLDRNNGLFVELVTKEHLGDFTRSDMADIDFWFRKKGPDGGTLAKEFLAAERREAQESVESTREDLEVKRSIARRSGMSTKDHAWFRTPGLAWV